MELKTKSNRQLRQGLCSSKIGRRQSPSVIVIGAGIAGLAAARALYDASFQVVVLESRDRIGGRICTNYTFGFPVDLGASWLHGVCNENPLAPLIGKLGLPLYRTSGDNSVLYDHDLESYALYDMDGNQVPQDLVVKVGEIFESILREYSRNGLESNFILPLSVLDWMTSNEGYVYSACKREMKISQCTLHVDTFAVKALHVIEQKKVYYVDRPLIILKRLAVPTDKIREENNEDMSIHQAFLMARDRRPDLRLEGLAHKVLQWYLCRMEGWFASDAETISLKCWDEEVLLPGGHGLMVRGYQPVINTIAKGLDIRINHRVTKVFRHHSGVEVTVENGTTFVADAAIIAAPLGVLKAGIISFEPRLPQWKEEAISQLGVGIENKIILHFENVFWPNVEFLGVVADNTYSCSYFLNLHKATGRPVLVYMPAGKLARDIEKMPDEEAANFAFTQLIKILPDANSPIQFLVSRWGSDINSLGSYTFDKVGMPHDLYEKLSIPVDNLFFAGEATSVDHPGSAHGAYSTGLEAAEGCRMRVLERYGELDLFQVVAGEGTASVPLQISRL